MTLSMPRHVPLNALYYFKGQVALTDAEVAERAIGPPKATVARNTRLPDSMHGPDPAVAAAVAAAAAASFLASGGGAGAGGGAGGFNRLQTPSFTPGREGFSPLMTWGEIGSTPLRLDGMDDFEIVLPPGAGTGPFQVGCINKLLGHSIERLECQTCCH